MSACAAEATHWDSFELETPSGSWAVLLCTEHALPTSEEIGAKANPELREHVKFHGAQPTF